MMVVEMGKRLRDLNLKATPKRLAILEALASEPVYASPEEIWRKVRQRFGGIGLPTVYRNLEELNEGGVVSRILHPNRQLYYHFCANSSHHHHFICVSCRAVQDLEFCGLERLGAEVSERTGGRILSHILQ
ncbi:MAG TPA: transcriptional repressor, partial [Verrucomicrobiae bacterium]|nr:transcriptional repressor [Verrucomicrobiae bacterium]